MRFTSRVHCYLTHLVMPAQGQFPTGCPEEGASFASMATMAETARLTRPDAALGRCELYLGVGRYI
jgi:hypothetical protein